MLTKNRKIINEGRIALMMKAKKGPKFYEQYENAVIQEYTENRVEVMLLMFAETLHDELGFGAKRLQNILNSFDARMVEYTQDNFDIDALRVRVFSKTKYMFALNKEDQDYILKMLEEKGFDTKLVGPEERD